MKIDFTNHDSIEQINTLRKLLSIRNPTREDLAIALGIAVLIFYENRPGKLHKISEYDISGTGCSNPYSYKTGEIKMGVLRLHVEIGSGHDFIFDLSYEFVQDGFLTANIYASGFHWVVVADMHNKKKENELVARNVIITGGYHHFLMQELKRWLWEPLTQLITAQGGVDTLISESEGKGLIDPHNTGATAEEKKFIQEVCSRFPKRSRTYFSVKPKQEDLEIQEKLFKDVSVVDSITEKIAVLEPYLQMVKSRVPVALRARIDEHFVFAGNENEFLEKHYVPKLFLERMDTVFGMVILRKLPFSFEELEELNNAWCPFIYIHPEYHSFAVYKPEAVAERHAKFVDEFFDNARKLTREFAEKHQ